VNKNQYQEVTFMILTQSRTESSKNSQQHKAENKDKNY